MKCPLCSEIVPVTWIDAVDEEEGAICRGLLNCPCGCKRRINVFVPHHFTATQYGHSTIFTVADAYLNGNPNTGNVSVEEWTL